MQKNDKLNQDLDKMKVLSLQDLEHVNGGRGVLYPSPVQSTESINCGTVTGYENSTKSNGCPRETK